MKTTIYKVYDDEWSEIMGEGQLKEFACSQIDNAPDDFEEENIWNLTKDEVKKVLGIVKTYWNTTFPNFPAITKEEAILLLTVRNFDIDEIEVY